MTPFSPATAEEIAYVIKHLSDQNKAERDVLKLSDDDLYARLVPLLGKGYSEVLFISGNPVYIFGVADGFTWFICTQRAWSMGLRGVRIARERVAKARAFEGRPLICVSYSPHPDAARWFKALGFVEGEPRSVDGGRVFVYP